MKIYFKIFLITLFLSIAMIRCSMEDGNKGVPDDSNQNADTTKQVKSEIPPRETVTLKETVINSKTVIDNKRISMPRVLNDTERNLLSLKSIDSPASDAFQYHLIDTLFSGSQIDIYLIGREYTEENILWIASYNKDSKLLDQVKVYYDNAEGALAIESVIKRKSISVRTVNEYAETDKERQKTEMYYFNESNKLVRRQ